MLHFIATDLQLYKDNSRLRESHFLVTQCTQLYFMNQQLSTTLKQFYLNKLIPQIIFKQIRFVQFAKINIKLL